MSKSLFTFCPYDGARLVARTDGEGRQRPTCSACGFVDYCNPKPCVEIVVEEQGRVLLGRRAFEPSLGLWDILGGFIETDETAEAAVHREIAEESGLQVRITRYLGSFPDVYGPWEVPTLSFAFTAEPIGGVLRSASDVAELRWFAAEDLPTEWAFPHQPKVIAAWRQQGSKS